MNMAVSGSWAAPVARKLAEIVATARDRYIPEDHALARISGLIDEVPSLYGEMDHDALADTLDAALGGAAVAAAAYVLGKMVDAGQELSTAGEDDLIWLAVAMDYSFGPWYEAAQKLAEKTPVAAKLTSREWEDVPLALRDRAFFSSRVESARLVRRMRDDLAGALAQSRDRRGRGFDRDNFIGRARELAAAEGVSTIGAPGEIGSIKDIRSVARLGLVYDTNTQMAQNWARMRTDFAAGALDAYPAWRFERIEDRIKPRGDAFWRGRWNAAGSAVGWRGASSEAMAALKTSPIWMALGALGPFGNPYPPFDWGSGMGVADLTREEAEAIGLLDPGRPMPPAKEPAGFNAQLDSDLGDLTDAEQDKLKEQFGDQVWIAKGFARWTDQVMESLYDSRGDYAYHLDLGAHTPAAMRAPGGNVLAGSKSHLSVLADSPLGSSRVDAAAIPHIWRAPDRVEAVRGAELIRMQKRFGTRDRAMTLVYDAETDTYTPVTYE